MYCGQCGAEISSGNQFCGRCGKAVDAEPLNIMQRTEPEYRPGSLRLFFWLFMISQFAYLPLHFIVNQQKFQLDNVAQLNPLLATGRMLLSIAVMYFGCSLLYRCWVIVQDFGRVPTTPGKAIAFYFVPFVNCYWAFVAQLGLAITMNAYCREREIDVPPVNKAIAFTSSLMMLICTLLVFYGMCYIATLENTGGAKQTTLYYMTAYGIVNALLFFFLYNDFSRVGEAILRYKAIQSNVDGEII